MCLVGFELHVVDFEMTGAANQNAALYANLTAGALPPLLAQEAEKRNRDVTPLQANNPQLLAPESTTGYEQIFNGSLGSGKVAVQRTLSLDLCGQIPDKGLLMVTVKPVQSGSFPAVHYTCAINLNIRTATRETESFWSDVFPCNAENASGTSVKLWYKVRQWNVNWTQCQQNRPSRA